MVFVVGLSGASCSGKTFLTHRLAQGLRERGLTSQILSQDRYYLDDLENYDVPEALSWKELIRDLDALKEGKDIQAPIYDYTTHRRTPVRETLTPEPVILVEGIFILHHPEVRKRLDLAIFIETETLLRFWRRSKRDAESRGRSPHSIYNQYINQVEPAYKRYIKPSRKHASIIILNNDPKDHFVGLAILTKYLFAQLG